VIFIVGGNGSGKSTLMTLLIGLYYPENGTIYLNQNVVSPQDYSSYRELFSTIFTDFYIFKKLYGLEHIDENEVNDLLRKMQLEKKTEYVNKQYTNTNLSTGQRKRLAYITGLLEDKSIYVFDEWAADQDPEFRKLFYNQFIDDMRIMGKTVIAVSHDDRYFDTADRIIKMEEGKIIPDWKGTRE
jgi:putative ATP-binding cassette transporter